MEANDLVALIYQHYEDNDTYFRNHHGGSQAGNPCLRAQWYSFRHTLKVKHNGRMLRLFLRGHREEEFFVQDLRNVGFDVRCVDDSGNQFTVQSAKNKHCMGSTDAYFRAPKDIGPIKTGTIGLGEFKTYNGKQFHQLIKAQSVKDVKPLHFAQMQLYMGWAGLNLCIYLAVCKDDDTLYSEIIEFSQEDFDYHERNMLRVVGSVVPPEPLYEDKSRYECKYCDYNEICYEEAFALHISCRTCLYAVPTEDGEWRCASRPGDPTIKSLGIDPYRGCQNHLIIPDLLHRFAKPIGSDHDKNCIIYETQDGQQFINGRDDGFTSHEIANAYASHPRMLVDKSVNELREAFSAKIGEAV